MATSPVAGRHLRGTTRGPQHSGPYKGLRADEEKYNEMLEEYYRLWGWQKTTGRLTRPALEKLGLDKVAKKLAAQGELAEI